MASSKAIAIEMGGDIKLQISKLGLTVFKFKIPVKVNDNNFRAE